MDMKLPAQVCLLGQISAPSKSAYQLGVDSGLAGESDPGPAGDCSSYSDRNYSRGWEEGNARRVSVLESPELDFAEEQVAKVPGAFERQR